MAVSQLARQYALDNDLPWKIQLRDRVARLTTGKPGPWSLRLPSHDAAVYARAYVVSQGFLADPPTYHPGQPGVGFFSARRAPHYCLRFRAPAPPRP